MIFLYAFLIVAAIGLSLYFAYRRAHRGHKSRTPLLSNVFGFFGFMVVATVCCFSQGAFAAEEAEAVASASSGLAAGLGYIGAGLAVGLSGIGGGVAVASSASAALGALSEDDSLFGRSLIFVGLAEGIALYGLLIAFMIISKL